MSTLHHRPMRSGLLALAVSIGTAAGAQTTFASSNNPSASLRIERSDRAGTRIYVEQARGSAAYQPVSQQTVLRDPETGVSYPLQALDSEVSPNGTTEHHTLTFAPFLDTVGDFELVDPTRPADALYFKGIRREEGLVVGQ